MKPLFAFLLSSLYLPAAVVEAWVMPHKGRYNTRPLPTTKLLAISPCWASEQGKELVDRFGSVWEEEIEKVYALEQLQVSQSKHQILDAALQYIQEAKYSVLGKRRWNIRLPSRRATMGCYGRILAEMDAGRISVTSQREPEEWIDDDDDHPLQATKRMNLFFILEILSTHPKGVWSLEKEMIQTAGIDNFGFAYGQTATTQPIKDP